MKDYKYGVYASTNYRLPNIGIGLVWSTEKYLHINFLFWELAVGKTTR